MTRGRLFLLFLVAFLAGILFAGGIIFVLQRLVPAWWYAAAVGLGVLAVATIGALIVNRPK